MAITLTAALAAPLAPAPAVAQAPPFWHGLEPGPHDVGFDRVWALDRSRIWSRAAALDSATGEFARPLRIDLWYPAECEGAHRMPLRDYMTMESPGPLYDELVFLTHRRDEYSYRGLPEDSAAFDRFMATPTYVKAAPAASLSWAPILTPDSLRGGASEPGGLIHSTDERHTNTYQERPTMSTIVRITIPVLLLASVGSGCDQDPTKLDPGPPTMDEVAGEYTAEGEFSAVSFLTTDGDEIVDWLAEGARFEIVLVADGTTTGELYIPVPDHLPVEDYFESEDIEQGYYLADLAGTWSLDGQTIRFQHAADTFVRDMDFVYNDGTLTGEETWSITIRVVLTRG